MCVGRIVCGLDVLRFGAVAVGLDFAQLEVSGTAEVTAPCGETGSDLVEENPGRVGSSECPADFSVAVSLVVVAVNADIVAPLS